MLVKTYGSAVHGVDATTITIEVNIDKGIKYFLVGLPDNAVKEGQQRIVSALKYHGLSWPRKQITINMAPADILGGMAIAIGVLASSGQILPERIGEYIIMGELSLDGSLQPIKGALPIAIQARKEGFKGFILPKQNAREAAIVNNLEVLGVESLQERNHHRSFR